MAQISSVLGPLDTADLGFTLSHEHVQVTSAGIQQVYPEFIDRQATITTGVAQLREAYAEGLRTIVDVTTIDLGRDIKLIEQVSRESGVQIVCATGTWLDIPRVFWTATPDPKQMIRVFSNCSMCGSSVRAEAISARKVKVEPPLVE